jgi:dTDP-3-amino-3,4,6-trideoxy-alpha-D-glucose transaminase
MTRVPVVDLARRFAAMEPELSEAIDRVLRSGRHLLGPETAAFEAEFAAFTGRRHAVCVASGTDALRLSLVAMGIGAGDEVVVPALTAVPTAAAVCAAGATPVFADIDPDTAMLDSAAAAAAMTLHTRAVIPVHLYGRPAPLPDIGVPVLEDAAQAHGALTPGGPGGVAAAYSFYPTKNLGGIGDGGAVVTDDDDLADRVRLLRGHGLAYGYSHEAISTNSRMSEIEAAVLRVGLRRLTSGNARRRQIAARCRAAAPRLRWQAPHDEHVYHLLIACVEDRDELRRGLPFDTGSQYALALTQQPAYRHLVRQPCPVAEAWAAGCVSFPCFPEMTEEEIDVVCGALR